MTISVVTVESLIVTGDELENKLKVIDPLNSDHRSTVISTIECLVNDYVLKASDCPESETGLELYSEEEVLEEEISGLIMNLFNNKIGDFTKAVSDEELKNALEALGIETRDSIHRSKFYRCWQANNAFSIILPLLNFIKQPLLTKDLPDVIKNVLPDEQKRIKQLADIELPTALSYLFRSLLERIEAFL